MVVSEIDLDGWERQELPMPVGGTEYRTVYRKGDQTYIIKTDRICVDRWGPEYHLLQGQRTVSRLIRGEGHGPVLIDMGGRFDP